MKPSIEEIIKQAHTAIDEFVKDTRANSANVSSKARFAAWTTAFMELGDLPRTSACLAVALERLAFPDGSSAKPEISEKQPDTVTTVAAA